MRCQGVLGRVVSVETVETFLVLEWVVYESNLQGKSWSSRTAQVVAPAAAASWCVAGWAG